MSELYDLDNQIFTNIKKVKIVDIIADLDMQQRVEFHDQIISEYTEILNSGGELAPLKVVRDKDKKYWLWDGFHTLEAAKRAGKAKIKVEISRGTQREAWLKSLGANTKHGIRRSRLDKRKAIQAALTDSEIQYSLMSEDGQHSLRSVAKLCQVHHSSVTKLWNSEIKPAIFSRINDLLRPDLQESQTESEWFADIANKLSVPTWVVAERHAKNVARRLELTSDKNDREELKGVGLDTLQSDTDTNTQAASLVAKNDREEPSGVGLDTLQSDTDTNTQAASLVTKNDREEPSGVGLDTLQSDTDTNTQAASLVAKNDKEELTGIGLSPFGAESTPKTTPVAEIVSTLTQYAKEQFGVKVVSATRPTEGWTLSAGKAISAAFKEVTADGLEDVNSVLILVVKD